MCSVGMAKSGDKWDDDLCSCCNGTILKWGDGEETKNMVKKMDAWCSWCVEKTQHILDEKGFFLKGRL